MVVALELLAVPVQSLRQLLTETAELMQGIVQAFVTAQHATNSTTIPI
jgi:hypothetical protein